jgi:PTH1 family peptidyl-tRNA hydrolase
VGFPVTERLRDRWRFEAPKQRFDGRFARGRVASLAGMDVGVLEPDTFMNLSGAAVSAALAKLPLEDPARDLLVVFDDADLPFGKLRLRASGSGGGHNGLGDILEKLGTRDVPRLRFGIGRPSVPMDTVNFVLGRFTPEEEKALGGHLDRAAQAVETFLADGAAAAMNRFNSG